MNRQTRRALSQLAPSALTAPLADSPATVPKAVTAALFAAAAGGCKCDTCRILRRAVAAMVAEALTEEEDDGDPNP